MAAKLRITNPEIIEECWSHIHFEEVNDSYYEFNVVSPEGKLKIFRDVNQYNNIRILFESNTGTRWCYTSPHLIEDFKDLKEGLIFVGAVSHKNPYPIW